MNNKICAIFGASGHGKVVAEIAELNGFEVVFFDDRWPSLSSVEHWSVVGDAKSLKDSADSFAILVVGIGDNKVRLQKQNELLKFGGNFVPLIHPQAVVSSMARTGVGTVVMAGAVINPFVRVGEACIVNTGATVDHDCSLADGVHLSPGTHLGGDVSVGKCSWLGIGSCVKQCIKIGDNAIVGAGGTVVSNVRSGVTVVGTPAK